MTSGKQITRKQRTAWRGLLILLVLFVFSASLDHPVQGQTRTDQSPTDQASFVVKSEVLVSQARHKTTHYLAFVPRGAATATYPVLFLLHGAWDDYRAWYQHAGDQLGDLAAQYHIVIVTPDGEPFGWYADSPYLKDNQIETYIIRELIPHVQAHLPVNERMSIAGLSMGGHGALGLAIRHPGLFQSAGSISGIVDITRHRNQFKLKDVFGPYASNTALWQDHAVDHLAGLHADVLQKLPMLVTVSRDDPWALQENLDLHQHLDTLGVPHQFRVDPGKHDWDYWLQQLPGQVAFHARYLHR